MPIREAHAALQLFREGHLPLARLRDLQNSRFKRLIDHASAEVPFYRDLFGGVGIHAREMTSLEDLQRLPVLDRTLLQTVPVGDRLSRGIDPDRCLIRHTGGSCGQPLAFLGQPSELDFEALGWLRTWRRLGLRLRDQQATIKYPDDIVIARSNRWYQKLGLVQVSYLDLRQPIPSLLESLQSLRPDVLRAPPSVLIALARETRHGELGETFQPRLVLSTSEKLRRSAARYVGEVLGGEVHDLYGATEAGCIAWRCPRCELYHLNSDYLHLEVLKDGRPARPGEVGQVVVTNLFRLAMPIIRLSLGDLCEVAETGDCPASTEPLSICRIVGRTIDSFQLPDGTEFSPFSFMPDDLPGVLAYRIVQEAPGQVRIFVVPGEELTEAALEHERRGFEALLPGSLSVQFSVVDRLPSSEHLQSRHHQAAAIHAEDRIDRAPIR